MLEELKELIEENFRLILLLQAERKKLNFKN
jgi:hypothetical protein